MTFDLVLKELARGKRCARISWSGYIAVAPSPLFPTNISYFSDDGRIIEHCASITGDDLFSNDWEVLPDGEE